jgi:hypothetical protein
MTGDSGATRLIVHGRLTCTGVHPCSSRGPVIASSRTHLFTCYHFMFINIPCRTSDCVERMVVDPVRAVVQVAYRKGNIYEYTCVSRRAILNLLLNPNMSLGFWVNANLLPFNCKTRTIGDVTCLNALYASDLPIVAA